ncbi:MULTISPECIES: DNA polymerase III subunit beta [unclassified Lacticaseibacillus]|uniref:DNA polymerase III subunit beta n=1 Tax=unclassified Lacticaseibacillus TaxID=2759744 RepID=UPI0019438E57|nr:MULTISPECIES: DNA polymerase III subunit beta [unclassified Lacticaseibacillus]
MKFTITRATFIKSLNDVSRAITSKTTIPILTNLKMDLTDNALVLTGSDADISIESKIDATSEQNDLQIEDPGSITVPARFFTEIVKRLPEKTMTVDVQDNYQTVITSGKSEFKINGLDANNYPRLPEVSGEDALTVPADVLRQLIAQTVIAVSTQESRPILTGVHIQIEKGKLIAVATDSHRLAQRTLDLPSAGDASYDVIIPGKSLTELGRTLTDDIDNVEIRFASNQVLFIAGNTLFYSRLLEGNYPDTSRLIPTTSTTTIEFDAPTLLSAIGRASLLSHESSNNVVRLDLNTAKQTATIYGNSPDVGNVEEALQFQKLEGDDLEISFNPDYMKDALQGVGATSIVLAFTAPLRPFTLVPTEDKEHFVQLITPVRTF